MSEASANYASSTRATGFSWPADLTRISFILSPHIWSSANSREARLKSLCEVTSAVVVA